MANTKQTGMAKLRKEILEVVSLCPEGGFRKVDVRHYLGHLDEAFFKEAFKSLVEDGTLVKKGGSRYVTKDSQSFVQGVIRVNAKGFGFVTPRNSVTTGDVFIPAQYLGGALSGDEVLIEVGQTSDPRGASGKVKKIVRRSHEEFVGCLHLGDDGFEVRPLRRELPSSLPLVWGGGGGDQKGAKEGDWVLAHLVPGRRANSPMMAEVVRRLAKSGSVTSDLNAIVKEYALPRNYTAADLKGQEECLPLQVPREDLTSLTMVTIDPVDAKDFDDAISYAPGPVPGQALLGVHIADVACYVTPDSKIDKFAHERGFTAYLPGRTLPMLPPLLSNDLCSLRQDELRLAHSVLMTVDEKTGEVLSSRRVHSLVKVAQRLTFDDVERHLAGQAVEGMLPQVVEMLGHLSGLAQTLRARRKEMEQFLPLQTVELRILCGGTPVRVMGIRRIEPNPAHELVEEFMLLANCRVAQEMLDNGILGLFRVHDEPDEKMLQEFAMQAAMMGQIRKMPQLRIRKALVGFLEQLKKQSFYDLVCLNFLRCLPRAAYSLECRPHFGLGKEVYCHFTSPIRRYADLLVHQQLLAKDLGQPGRDEQFMFQAETAVNALEQNVDQASFAASDRLKLKYLDDRREEQPGELHEAQVVRAMAAGLSVYLPEYGLMGFIERSQFRDGTWRYDARSYALVNLRGGKQRYRCGDTVYVRVRSVDVVRGELNLRPM